MVTSTANEYRFTTPNMVQSKNTSMNRSSNSYFNASSTRIFKTFNSLLTFFFNFSSKFFNNLSLIIYKIHLEKPASCIRFDSAPTALLARDDLLKYYGFQKYYIWKLHLEYNFVIIWKQNLNSSWNIHTLILTVSVLILK